MKPGVPGIMVMASVRREERTYFGSKVSDVMSSGVICEMGVKFRSGTSEHRVWNNNNNSLEINKIVVQKECVTGYRASLAPF